jgi:hypothetical protein
MPYGLYPPMPRSPITYLSDGIDASVTTIPVDDVSKLPVAPNIATIGDGADSETIKYTGKTDSSLTGVTRGFEGEARAWNSGVPIANVPCAQHIGALQEAVDGIEGRVEEAIGTAMDDVQSAIDGITQDTSIMRNNTNQTMAAMLKAQNNTSHTTFQVRNVVLSTGNPTGGSNGDIWIKYA